MVSDREHSLLRSPIRTTASARRTIPLQNTTPRREGTPFIGQGSSSPAPSLLFGNSPTNLSSPKFPSRLSNAGRPNPGRRRRRSLDSSHATKKPRETTADSTQITSALIRDDDELGRLDHIITSAKQRCKIHETEIDALQREIKIRSQQWQELLEQSRDATEQASASHDRVQVALKAIKDTDNIEKAKQTKVSLENDLRVSDEAIQTAWENIDAGRRQGIELREKLAEEETMLLNVERAYKWIGRLTFWLSTIFGIFVFLIYVLIRNPST